MIFKIITFLTKSMLSMTWWFCINQIDVDVSMEFADEPLAFLSYQFGHKLYLLGDQLWL